VPQGRPGRDGIGKIPAPAVNQTPVTTMSELFQLITFICRTPNTNSIKILLVVCNCNIQADGQMETQPPSYAFVLFTLCKKFFNK
jgi:hypothetical protein